MKLSAMFGPLVFVALTLQMSSYAEDVLPDVPTSPTTAPVNVSPKTHHVVGIIIQAPENVVFIADHIQEMVQSAEPAARLIASAGNMHLIAYPNKTEKSIDDLDDWNARVSSKLLAHGSMSLLTGNLSSKRTTTVPIFIQFKTAPFGFVRETETIEVPLSSFNQELKPKTLLKQFSKRTEFYDAEFIATHPIHLKQIDPTLQTIKTTQSLRGFLTPTLTPRVQKSIAAALPNANSQSSSNKSSNANRGDRPKTKQSIKSRGKKQPKKQ